MTDTYEPVLPKLRELLAKLRLRVDYDPDFTTLTVYPRDEGSEWGVMDFDGIPASPYERDMFLLESIEDHPHFEKLLHKEVAPTEKLGMVLMDLDGDKWYAASYRKVKTLRPALFGKDGKIWLSSFSELAMIRVMSEVGRRRVGFNRSGDQIRGTLQVEHPGKIPWSRQVYLYEFDPKKLDLSRVFRRGQFQFEIAQHELKPDRVFTSTLATVRRLFNIEPLYQDK